MSELTDLYQEVILDHNRQPRNFRKLPDANRSAEGFNPLCGDHIYLYIKLGNDRIEEIGFQGSGCAISKASSSLMTTLVKGKSAAEINPLFEKFHDMVTGQPPKDPKEDLGKLKVFAGVAEFPARVKCASLAWHTLKAALEGKNMISTEGEKNDGPADC